MRPRSRLRVFTPGVEIETYLSSWGVEVGGSPFVFPFDGTPSFEDSLSPLEPLDDDDDDDDESSDSGFIVCCADCFDLEEGPDKPSPAEP